MDLKKIGQFTRELRKQRGLTQDQLAQMFGVTNRTVSRWENGNNLPDLDILIQMSDYYEVDIRELLDGERKSGIVNKETKETVVKTAEYTATQTQRRLSKMNRLLCVGVILWGAAEIIEHTPLTQMHLMSIVSAFMSGAGCGLVIVGAIATSRYGQKLKAFKAQLVGKSV